MIKLERDSSVVSFRRPGATESIWSKRATSGRYLPRPMSRREMRLGCSSGTTNISLTRPTKFPKES